MVLRIAGVRIILIDFCAVRYSPGRPLGRPSARVFEGRLLFRCLNFYPAVAKALPPEAPSGPFTSAIFPREI